MSFAQWLQPPDPHSCDNPDCDGEVCEQTARELFEIIEAQMATLDQVMLPYLKVDDSHTLYEAYTEREQNLAIGGAS